MPKKISNAKIACLDFSLQKSKMKMGVQVLVEDPEKLEAIRQRFFQFLSKAHNYRGTIKMMKHHEI